MCLVDRENRVNKRYTSLMNLLFLTCATEAEAKTIAKTLLERKLIACAKLTSVESQFLWKNSIENANEMLLVMESHESRFSEVEKTVKELHSYEQFVLIGLPVTNMASGVENWLKTEMVL